MTDKRNWTAGPWVVSNRASFFVEAQRHGHNGGICSTGGYSYNAVDGEALMDENIANAHLIAAAPDLYEALENLLAIHNGDGGTKYHAGDIAAAALSKARGET